MFCPHAGAKESFLGSSSWTFTTFFVSRGEGQLKERTLIGVFVVFELVVVLPITKLHTHYITVSDI